MDYRFVIFDFDDTIVRTKEAKWAQHKFVAKQEFGKELSDKVLAEHWGKPYNQTLLEYYDKTADPNELHKVKMLYEHLFPVTLCEGFLDVLNYLLKQHIQVGILSSSLTSLVIDDLQRLGIDLSIFTLIHGYDKSNYHKPDPRVFDSFLSNIEHPRDTLVYVGNDSKDCIAAKRAEINFIGVGEPIANVMQREQKEYMLYNNMHELAKAWSV